MSGARMKKDEVSSFVSTALRAPRASFRLSARVAALLVAIVVLVAPERARADSPPPRISLLTMGPGNSLFTMFGHDALLVERVGMPSLVYNFGMYTPESITPPRVLSGRLRYYLSVEHYGATLAQYRRERRSVLLQRLTLEPAAAGRLAAALSENSKPANAAYRYDYAADNCTTRVRDALDRALDGLLRRSLAGTVPTTYRDHALRMSAGDLRVYLAFDLGLGSPADRPLSTWEDAYLPDRLAQAVRSVKLASGEPLVSSEEVLAKGAWSVAATPPRRWHWFALSGLVGGAICFALGRRGGRAEEVALGLVATLFGLVAGGVGLCLLLLLGTEVHPATRSNVNLLLAPPWALLLVIAGVRTARGRIHGLRSLVRVALVGFAGSVLAVALSLVFGQESQRLIALLLPMWLGLFLGARSLLRAPPRAV
jgi:hypothetical protein